MIVKVHGAQGKKIVAVVDSVIYGKKFEEGNLQLDLTADFYKGDEKSVEEIEILVRGAYIIHFVGKESVDFGIKRGLIDKKNVVQIKKIPHAEVIASEV